MGFLKRIFGGDSKPAQRDETEANALILYIKVKKCGAIARIRVDLRNDLSLDDEGEGYVMRKQIVDSVCYGKAELEIRFDANHRELSRTITDGEIVTREDWQQQENQRSAQRGSNS